MQILTFVTEDGKNSAFFVPRRLCCDLSLYSVNSVCPSVILSSLCLVDTSRRATLLEIAGHHALHMCLYLCDV